MSSAIVPPLPHPSVHVSLDTSNFEDALSVYLENAKPDQLAQKQANSWVLNWTDNHATPNDDDKSAAANNTQWCIAGYLEIHAEHMVVRLDVKTRWDWNTEEAGGGKLEFAISARARFRTKSELKKQEQIVDGDKEAKSKNRKEERVTSKVRTAMSKRLREDDYIRKLLTDDNGPPPATLMEATVRFRPPDELEERVSLEDDLLEAFRRCVYSQAEDTLNVVDLLGSFPFLHTPACPLGKRAKLRLLEDAMLDACEREGEDELLTDLTIADDDSKQQQEARSKQSPSEDGCGKRRKRS